MNRLFESIGTVLVGGLLGVFGFFVIFVIAFLSYRFVRWWLGRW